MPEVPENFSDTVPFQLMDADGTVQVGANLPLSSQEIVEAFRLMLLSRQIDTFAVAKQRLGVFGTYGEHTGQEATLIGSSFFLNPKHDWIVPQYREMPAMIRHGMPLEHFFLLCSANPAGFRVPDGMKALPTQVSLAAQIPHAVGLAWGLSHQGKPDIVATYFGDGASSEGDFHEALNLAGIRSAPVVFVMQNNGYAISTPVTKQSATSSFAVRARGYGFPGIMVDGNDLLAVAAASKFAIERARNGEGPTLIECKTHRMKSHNTSDDHTIYADQELLAKWEKRDPLSRLRKYLLAQNLWSEEIESRELEQIKIKIDAAFELSSTDFKGEVRQVFENVYDELPSRLAKQYEDELSRWQI